ncbi:MAG: alpha/beta hydrolase fold domain-containing protein [Propionicimonas sp.]
MARATPAPRDLRVWTPTSNRFGWSSYLGTKPGGRHTPPYAVPARRDDLQGLPPAWIGVGTEDLFFEEDAEYARRLTAAGVSSHLVVVPGAFHGFDSVLPRKDVSRRFLDEQVAALATVLFSDA